MGNLDADFIKAPQRNYDDKDDGYASTIIYSFSSTSATNTIPKDFEGCYVRVKAIGANVCFYFAREDSTEVDFAAAGSAEGNDDLDVGWYMANGEVEDMILPSNFAPNGRIYLVRDGSGDGNLYIRKS